MQLSLTVGNDNKETEKALKDRTEEEWREILTPKQFYVLREEGTEAPNTSELNFVKEAGTFTCAGCAAPLFTTSTKFDSGTGWPSFSSPIDSSSLELSTDFKLILPRTECTCNTCGGHLGHVFDDGPDPKTGQRFCINGVALTFTSDNDNPSLEAAVQKRSTQEPYKLSIGQVVPSLLVNLIIGGLFFNAFLVNMSMNGGVGSGIGIFEVLPLLPGLYYGWMVVRSLSRLF